MNGTVQKKPSTRLTLIYIAIISVILAAVGIYISTEYDALYVLKTIKRIDVIFILLGISMIFVQLYCEAGALKLLFSLLGKMITLSAASGYTGTDLFYSNISPAQLAGLPAAGYSMHKDGIDVPTSCTVLAIYSMCNRLAVVLIASVSVLAFPLLLKTGSALFTTLFIYGTVVNISIITLFAICVFTPSLAKKLVPATLSFLTRIKFLRISDKTVVKAERSVHRYVSAAKIMRGAPMSVFLVLIICVFKRLINFTITYFAYLSFGLSGESYMYIIALQSVLAVSAESVPIPGSAGVAENVFTILYSNVFGPRLYVAAMIVTRAINFFVLLVVSGCYALIQNFIRKRKY